MNKLTTGLAAAVLAAGLAAGLAACGSSGSAAAPKPTYGQMPRQPANQGPQGDTGVQARQYDSCFTIMTKLHATRDESYAGLSGTASEDYAGMKDGTQVDCVIGNPNVLGPEDQTVSGPGWYVTVYGATTPAQVASILGGSVG